MNIIITGNVFPMGKNIAYGGERIIFYLVQELVKLGHKVYVFARKGSDFAGIGVQDYIPTGPLRGDKDVHFEAVKNYLDKHPNLYPDLYFCGYFGDGWNPSCQYDFPGYVELTWCRWCHAAFQRLGESFNVVSYSKVLQQDFFNSGVPTTMIHYGIPKDLYRFNPRSDDYAVWIGKVEGGKAPRLAIKLALAAGMKIVLMGPPYNTSCFWDQIGPYLNNPNVFWVRGVDDEQKYKIMSRAKVFISSNDNTWKEHFGIVNIEALSMGTPIIGFNRIGQDCAIKLDSIIEDGVHGFLLNYHDSTDERAVIETGLPLLARINEISRFECRKQFEDKFTSALMARRYEWFFNRIVEGERYGSVVIPF